MDSKTFRKAALYMMNLKVGDGYQNQDGNFVICVKHTKKKIVMSDGNTFRYGVRKGNIYMVGEPTGNVGLLSDTYYVAVVDVVKWFESRDKVKV